MQRKNIMVAALFSLALSAAHAAVVSTLAPQGQLKIEHQCSQGTCSAWLVNGTQRKPLFSRVAVEDVDVKWLSPQLADVSYSCGSPCDVHVFAGTQGVSPAFDSVLAVDPQRSCVLYSTGKGLATAGIFSGPKHPLWQVGYHDPHYRFYTGAADIASTIEAKFLPNGSVKLKYMNSDGDDNHKLIHPRCPAR